MPRPSMVIQGCVATLFAMIAATDAYATERVRLECHDRLAAKKHLERGLELYEQKKLDAALPELRRSRESCPTENNTLNLALLLRDLGRPVDALDMLDVLRIDFPTPTPENEETAKKMRTDLESIIGSAILDGDCPGATITIDGSSAGAMPMARPIRLPVGMHIAKIELQGYRPLETSFIVDPKKTTTVAVALAPLGEPPPKPRPKLPIHAFRFDVAMGLSPSLGGTITDKQVEFNPPGLGAVIIGRYQRLIYAPWRIGVMVGYDFAWQYRAGRICPDATGSWCVHASDDLVLQGFFAAPEVATEFYPSDQRFDVRFALGVIGGPLVNWREPQPDTTYFRIVQPATPSAAFVGVVTYLQGSWHSPWLLFGRWPTLVTLGLMGTARVSTPTYKDRFYSDEPTSPPRFTDNLLGSWVLTITPGIALEYDL